MKNKLQRKTINEYEKPFECSLKSNLSMFFMLFNKICDPNSFTGWNKTRKQANRGNLRPQMGWAIVIHTINSNLLKDNKLAHRHKLDGHLEYAN